jgi:hypothetical protein
LDDDHVDGFARRESGAGDIDIGVWLVVFLVSSEGRPVRRFDLAGSLSAGGGQIKYLRGMRPGPDSLVAGIAEARRLSLTLAVGAWSVWVWVWSALIFESAGALADCCGPPEKGINKPANVRVIICSAMRRAAPKFFLVRRISLLIFFF